MLQVVRWGTLLWVTTISHGGDFLGSPRRRLVWAFPFILLLHPTPYFVTFLVVFTIWALEGKVESIWLWLLGGLYAHVVFSGLTMLRVRRLQRKGRGNAGPNKRWRGP